MIRSYLRAGNILRQLRAEKALAQHSRTRFGNPNPAEAHNNLGVFYTRLGVEFKEAAFFDLAADALEAALQIEPQAFPVINNLGNAYFELRRLEEAARAYRRVLEVKPDLAQTHFNLGLVYERQGALDLAAHEYQKALTLQPGWLLPRMNLKKLEASRRSKG